MVIKSVGQLSKTGSAVTEMSVNYELPRPGNNIGKWMHPYNIMYDAPISQLNRSRIRFQ